MSEHDADIVAMADGDGSGDPLLAELRSARPEPPAEVLSPHTPPNRALVDEIIRFPPATVRSTNRRRRQVAMAAVGSAVAAAAIGVAVAAPFGSDDERTADALIRDAAVASERALADTGRAIKTDGGGKGGWYHEQWEFSAGDISTELTGGGAGTDIIRHRFVDGELYGDYDDGVGWIRDTCLADGEWRPEVPDIAGLLAVLEPDANFEIVGEEEIDGVPTTHLRASTPGAVHSDDLGLGYFHTPGLSHTLTSLDVWVDDDDRMRKIEFDVTTTYHGNDQIERTELTVEFRDLGDDITVEAPADYSDICGVG
jgi:hypothetical protein